MKNPIELFQKSVLVLLLVIFSSGIASAAYHVGDDVADFTLNDSDGSPVSLFDYNGKVVFIQFWGIG